MSSLPHHVFVTCRRERWRSLNSTIGAADTLTRHDKTTNPHSGQGVVDINDSVVSDQSWCDCPNWLEDSRSGRYLTPMPGNYRDLQLSVTLLDKFDGFCDFACKQWRLDCFVLSHSHTIQDVCIHNVSCIPPQVPPALPATFTLGCIQQRLCQGENWWHDFRAPVEHSDHGVREGLAQRLQRTADLRLIRLGSV